MKKINHCLLISALSASLPLFSQEGIAQDQTELGTVVADSLKVAVYAELESDDNIRKENTNEKSDLKQTVGVDVGLDYQSRAITLGMQYGLTHEEYQQNSYDGKTRLEGFLSAMFSSNPERYSWVFQHQQTIANISSLGANTSDNTEQRSTFTTGPNINLNLSPVDVLTASARYIDTSFDQSGGNDSQRNQAQLSLQHRLNQFNSVGLNASYTDVEAEQRDDGYKQQQLGLTYNSQLKYGQYSLEVGGSKLERNAANVKDVNGAYGNISYSASSAGQSFGASFNHDITDSSIGLSLDVDPASDFQSGDTNFNDFDVVTRDRYQLYYTRTNVDGRINASLTLAHDEEDYEILLQDQKSSSVDVGFNYKLGENLSTFLNVGYEQTEFIDLPQLGEDTQQQITIGLNHSIRNEWRLSYAFHYDERQNNDVATREYTSMGGSFRVNYQFR